MLGFGEAVRLYLDSLTETGGKDLDMKRYRLRMHLCPFFGDKPLSRVTTFDVERYTKKRLDAGAAPGSINRELAALSHMFTKGVEWKWLDHKPAAITRLEEDNRRITYLTHRANCAALKCCEGRPKLAGLPLHRHWP
ncbi:MAG: hypothetical protein USCGTAYLOR_02707 [Chromatiales bacterium USCg_Taylor]|nr:MAG: hypothetical protein USCGTAYLOR_02707 [Chromatiales bacterium USCg_Taylor]